ncbi:MAG: hypothetical protein ACU85V_16490, partial [Gammaproteobacteria bacterium]
MTNNRPLDSVRNPALEAAAAELYSADLPYHNFEHIEDTLAAAAVIVARCQDEHIRINTGVVYYALLLHDAGYHEDHRALGYATKEAYSAALADELLERFEVSESERRKTHAAILATERDASFVSAEQKAVRAADLSGMAADYPDFLVKSLNLKREFELLHGRELSWPEWQENSREVLGFYLGQEIRLTSYFYNDSGESDFHTAVRRNLDRL